MIFYELLLCIDGQVYIRNECQRNAIQKGGNKEMTTLDNVNQRVSKLSIIDVKLAQWCAIFLTLIIVKIIPEIMSINIWWFIGLLILCAIKPMYSFFVKN